MCSICGIVVKDDEDSSIREMLREHLINVMRILKHRGPDSSGAMFDDEVIYFKDFKDVLNSNLRRSSRVGLGHNRLAIVGNASQPIPNEDESVWVICNGEIYHYYELMGDLEDRHNFSSDTDSEVIVHCYEEGILQELDGEYAYCIYDREENKLLLARDTFGVKPLFYIDTERYFAFASERKGLWYLLRSIDNLSFKEIYNYPVASLDPNSQLIYNLDENRFHIVKNIQKIRMDYFNQYKNGDAVSDYELCKREVEKALWNGVIKRVRGLDKVGIIFSGGVDSTLVAKMASEYCKVTLYTSGLEGCEDLEYGERIAEDLGLKLRMKVIDREEYEEYLLKVAYAIDEIDLMKLSVGVPIYVASEMARRDGIKVVLSGQGADELFAGYKRYQRILLTRGEEELKKILYRDVMNIHRVNLERDDHCTMANSVELRVPFLDKSLVEVALSLPLRYKINERERKIILRDIARKYIPEYVAYRPKKAAQYGSGSEKMIYTLGRSYGYSKRRIDIFLRDVLLKKMEEVYREKSLCV
ncbi:MAG TPA: asparagine synthase (glutamine-hydrolyzing) [Methanococcaceae archaeon]|uniref:Putative asparagine synthetase [glutamine-hydrolyzing] n=1 Tax=Methanothermococcus okinawensis TaxID=155863 RepID=A0A833E4E7_9EURY|nr:asparagine synthase (glutamine-hydrolyzing) [Methanococcaceae archaeon]HIP91702.1 asparagine synthase (glutamine-hydrolyzing) [Methanothermococcus okinawensis]